MVFTIRILENLGVFQLNFQYMHDIENYMLEEHWELRQAATELMCNMSVYSETIKWFEDEKYDRLKVSLIYRL